MDFNVKGPESPDMDGKYPGVVSLGESQHNEFRRSCVDCQTTKTPLWRGGPAGPKSLCNACGNRYRKKRGALLGLNKGEQEKKKERKNMIFKLRLLALGRDVLLQRSMLQKQRKLAEEEEAAVLLMALSSGFVYA